MSAHVTEPGEPSAHSDTETAPAQSPPAWIGQDPVGTVPTAAAPGRARRRAPLIAAGVALLVGAAAGAAVSAAVIDPTASDEYRTLAAENTTLTEENGTLSESLDTARARADDAEGRADDAEAAAQEAKDEADRRLAELDEREADLDAREKDVTAVEERIQATSIGEGIWTVGVDIEPGTYRTKEPLSGYCYWGIYRSGTNGEDIIENDGPEGGFPTVTLSAGQDFENSGCGTFVKQ